MTAPRVSIIVPMFNAVTYVASALQSVLAQTMESWEALVVDDGSTDASRERLQPYFRDDRIRYFRQENRGVSVARNLGLKNATGEWISFLDADDAMTPHSLRSRLELGEKQPHLAFIDGRVDTYDASLKIQTASWTPSFRGMPFETLLFQTDRCFKCPSWLVRNTGRLKPFKPGMTHGEDLLFFLMNAGNGEYSFVEETVLRYRRGHSSAMDNLRGLEEGYRTLYQEIKLAFPALSPEQLERLRWRYTSIMRRSYLRRGALRRALSVSRGFSR